jgi:hypothetical protein
VAAVLLFVNGDDMKPTKQQQPPTVTEAEQAISNLESKRQALVARRDELATNRASVAFKALHEDDATAKSVLERINKESIEHDHQLASVDAALVTAKARLDSAKRAEARAADRAKAVELRAALQQFNQHAAGVDAALEVLIASCNGLQESLTAMNRCGSAFPTDAQLQSFGGRVLLGALSKTPFRRNFETLPPLERDRSMARIAQQWSDTVERDLQRRLGDPTNEVAA